MNILITGGNGYLGSKLVPMLNEHSVVIYDIKDSCVDLPKNCIHLKEDICEESSFLGAINTADVVIHLAGIVGFPACDADPDLARRVNVDATNFLIKNIGDRLLIFASTQSVYGAATEKCSEESPVAPTSLYAETKAIAEKALIESGAKAVILRFGTGFGVSPAMRNDLLINNFVQLAIEHGWLEVFEPNFERSFIHVSDMARAIVFAMNNYKRMLLQPFNVGDESMNLTKQDVASAISRRLSVELREGKGKDKEKRNYSVYYDKIHRVGFRIKTRFLDGLDELVNYYMQRTEW